MAFTDFIRKAVANLMPKEMSKDRLKITVATSGVMDNAISLWSKMYENIPPWRGGEEGITTLNLPAAISEEMARLILTEFSIEVGGSARAEFLDEQLQENLVNLSSVMELYCAKGGIALKPYVSGQNLNIDFTQADRFYPTAYNSNREITGAFFIDTKRQGDYLYTRFEYHNLIGTQYTIINKAFRSERIYVSNQEDYLAVVAETPYLTPVPLTEVSEWESLSEGPVVINNIQRPLFVYIPVPRANNIDAYSPLGTSVYARAVDVIEQADRQFSRILWEYKATEAAVHASEDMFDQDKNGRPILPSGKERLYRAFDIVEDKPFFEEYAPAIRDASLFSGLNKYFQRIEFLCGLSYGTISDPQQIEKTATEIRHSKQRSYTVVARMQDIWNKNLDNLLYAMDVITTLYGLAPEGAYEKSVTWGDGILEDTEAEYQRRWAQVLAGKLRPELFMSWYYGCTEEEALEMIPNSGEDGVDGFGWGDTERAKANRDTALEDDEDDGELDREFDALLKELDE